MCLFILTEEKKKEKQLELAAFFREYNACQVPLSFVREKMKEEQIMVFKSLLLITIHAAMYSGFYFGVSGGRRRCVFVFLKNIWRKSVHLMLWWSEAKCEGPLV